MPVTVPAFEQQSRDGAYCVTVPMTAVHLGRVDDSDSLIQKKIPPLQSSYCCVSRITSEGVKSEAFLNG